MARRPVTPKVRAASRSNIRKAQMSRVRTKEPRQVGRLRPLRKGLAMRVR